MNDTSLHDYMQIGIVQFMIYPECISGDGPILETVSSLVDDGFFDFLELGPINSATVRKQVISVMSQARVGIEYDGQPLTLLPGLDLESPDKTQRTRAVNAMKVGIDQAAEFSSPSCGVMSGKLYPANLNQGEALQRLCDSMVELCEYATQYNVTLCLENFDQIPYSKDCLVGPTAMAAELSAEVRKHTANFGLLPDLSHTPIMNETPSQMIEAAKGFIIRTQIGNSSTNPYSSHYGDNHPYFGAPLTDVGITQLTEFLQALVNMGFLSKENKGKVGFEVKPSSGEDPLAIIAGSKRALLEAWKRVEI